MKEIKDELKTIRESQIRMEEDVKHHIERTDLLEEMVIPLNNWRIAIKMFGKLLVGIGLLAGTIYGVKRAVASDIKLMHNDSIYATLNDIQSEVSCKILVHSGIRTKLENERVGGAKHSYHLYGRALDISAPCLTMKELAIIAYKYNTIIFYKSHIHIDNRDGKQCLVRVGKYYRKCRYLEYR